MTNIYICNQLGTAYKLEGDTLMFMPLSITDKNGNHVPESDSIMNDVWSEVELDLIGEENVDFNGVFMTIYEAAEIIKDYLKPLRVVA